MTTTRKSKKFIHEGKYAAEVIIELHYGDESWSPTMSLDDARNWKLSVSRCSAAISPEPPNTVAFSS
jgi:hypothetical protein